MSSFLSRRHFLRFALVGAGMLGAAPLLSLAPSAALARAFGSEETYTRTALFMGTMVTITVAGASAEQAGEAVNAALALGRNMADILTRFSASGPLGQLNASTSLNDTPPELMHLMQRSQQMYARTGGAFDPTVLPLLHLLESRREQKAQKHLQLDQAELRNALEMVGMERVHADGSSLRLERQGMGITLDGIAKGYIADAISHSLNSGGYPNHCVNAGGDIAVNGGKAKGQPWRIAIEDPYGKSAYPQVIEVYDGAVGTSGIYEIFYNADASRNHLVNPVTGASAGLASVTVTAPDCLTADALATAMAVMPPREALHLADSLPGCACCLLRHDGLTQCSRNWRGRRA
ncbi:FAD:protein FMN transferase [Desulfovibrio sp.]|uniref:FAD:protein FMN transferase n=1 Tax=Desulfovibrio sp. TaxID=885 RepID=UPI0025BAD8E4|nr:FAD:protein FMN transferase [Desulfovibrio sp.]